MKQVILCLLLCTSCVPMQGMMIDSSSSAYRKAATRVSLGDDMAHVLAILQPTQRNVPFKSRKASEQFIDANGTKVEIHFFRSSRQADGMTTDDEFTPYVFANQKLIAIGWTALGNVKSQGVRVK